MKLQEFKSYTCISRDSTKHELLGTMQNTDLCKMKYSQFIRESCS